MNPSTEARERLREIADWFEQSPLDGPGQLLAPTVAREHAADIRALLSVPEPLFAENAKNSTSGPVSIPEHVRVEGNEHNIAVWIEGTPRP